MNSQISKIKTYIGFAIKSREIKYGVDDIIKMRNPKLIIASELLGESSLEKLKKFSKTKNLEVILLGKDVFFELMQNESIKAIAIENSNLAEAINKNLTNI